MNDATPSNSFRARWAIELLLSFYSALLIVTSHEAPGLHWSTRLRHYFTPLFGPEPPDDGYQIYVVAFCLIWATAVVIFLCVQLVSRFVSGRKTLGIIVPVITIVAFPSRPFTPGTDGCLFLKSNC